MTLKATDLRIGNYVWNEIQNIPVKVDLAILSQQIAADKGHGKSWKPILLTEEILLKCGFEYNGEMYKGYKLFNLNNIYVLCGNNEFRICIYGCLLDMNLDISSFEIIKYLHQLQNCYYYNSNNKELEINL